MTSTHALISDPTAIAASRAKRALKVQAKKHKAVQRFTTSLTKDTTHMPETTETTPKTKTITRTVFDLAVFDGVQLTKEINLPVAPTSLEEALAAVGNDSVKLLSVIHEGLCAAAEDSARVDMRGFREVGEDGEPGEVYTGQYADEEKTKQINGMVLNFAKMAGYSKDLPKDKKKELKDAAKAAIRPILIATLSPKAPTATTESAA